MPCTRQLQEEREKEKKEFTVLAEFSSVVADTQQYIVDEEHTQGQSQVYIYALTFHFKFSGNLKGFFLGKWCTLYNSDIFKALNNASTIFLHICCTCTVHESL